MKKKNIIFAFGFSLMLGLIALFVEKNRLVSVISFLSGFVLAGGYYFVKSKLALSAQIKKMEDIFPDFIDLMASNLRAGITIDKALLLSSRKEFAPLDKEILRLGKEIVTGKEITLALKDMAQRTKSDKIKKTVFLIVTGIKSGGNLSSLLEETAVRLRERSFVEKKAASNVLMYEIFIFVAIAIGAPALLALSSILVNSLTQILGNIPQVSTTISMPFSLTKITVSQQFIMYFSLVFLVVIDFMACLLLGLVNKGEEKAGLNYLIPLLAISLGVFFLIRIALMNYFSGLIG